MTARCAWYDLDGDGEAIGGPFGERPRASGFEHVHPRFRREDHTGAETADGEDDRVVGGRQLDDPHPAPLAPAHVHLHQLPGERDRLGAGSRRRPHSDEYLVGRVGLEPGDGALEHEQPGGEQLRQLRAAARSGLAQPARELHRGPQRGVEPVEVLGLGDRAVAVVVLPEAGLVDRREGALLAAPDSVALDLRNSAETARGGPGLPPGVRGWTTRLRTSGRSD